MKLFKPISAVLFILIWIQPLQAQEQLREIGYFDTEGVLFDVQDVLASNEGSYYVVDEAIKKVYKFDKGHNKVGSAGGQGRGPAEFMGGPFKILKKDNSLFVFDRSPARIVQVFDLNLDYQTTLDMRFGYDSVVFGSSHFLLHYHDYENDKYVHLYSSEGEKLYSLEFDEFSEEYIHMNRIMVDRISDGKYVVVFENLNKICIYGNEFSLIHSFSLDYLPEKAPVSLREGAEQIVDRFSGQKRDVVYRSSYFPEFSIFESLATDSKGNFFVQVNSDVAESEDNIFVFNDEGEYKTSFFLPDEQYMMEVDQNWRIYTTSSARDAITIYEMEENQ